MPSSIGSQASLQLAARLYALCRCLGYLQLNVILTLLSSCVVQLRPCCYHLTSVVCAWTAYLQVHGGHTKLGLRQQMCLLLVSVSALCSVFCLLLLSVSVLCAVLRVLLVVAKDCVHYILMLG
jgi:uncharacterized membrane protein